MVNVRVRGIYATAISKILMEYDFKLIEASDIIRERLGIDLNTSPCDVTVKDTEDPDEVLVIGSPDDAKRVFNVLVGELKYVFKWESEIELNSVYLALVKEKRGEHCTLDLGELKATLHPCRENVGAKIVVGIRHSPIKPGDRLVLTRNFRIAGRYMYLIHGEQKISFSEHIRDENVKARLSAIATAKLMGSGLGVHFRSSAKYASKESLIGEIELLIEEYKRVLQLAQESSDPAKLRGGEFVGLIGLTSLAKQILDERRKLVAFTLYGHHSLKSMGLSDIVDFAESILSTVDEKTGIESGRGVLKYLARRLEDAGRVEILHIKPTGETIRLQPGRVVDVKVNENGLIVILERIIRSQGVYDGLNIEKKPGDIDYVVVDTSKPILQHNYFRDGNWIGTYVNINTPPEVSPGVIKYHDLILDVVILPNREPRTIDADEMEKLHARGIITSELYMYAKKAVQQVLLNPGDYVFNPLRNHRN